MPLIIEDIIKESTTPRSDVTSFCVEIENRYFSKQYNLKIYDANWAEGMILDISKTSSELSKEEREVFEKYVIGKNVRLYIVPGIFTPFDKLYFDEKSWSILRDAAIFPYEYRVKIKIERIIIEDLITKTSKSINVYPYRDVMVKTS